MAIVVALLAAMAVYLARNRAELAAIARLSPGTILVTSVLQLLAQLFLNASMLLPLRTLVKDLGFWELYAVRAGGSVVGSLLPVAGGVAVRLAYLRRRGVTYLDFTWATLVSNVLALAAAGALAMTVLTISWGTAGRPPQAVLAVAAGVFVLSAAAVAVLEAILRASRAPMPRRWAWLAQMPSLGSTPGMTAGVFLHSMGRHGLNFVIFGLLAQSLTRAPGDFLSGGLLYALTSPVRMVNITPANLGVTEWVVALVGKALAFDLTTGLVAALAFRGVSLVAVGLGMVVASARIALPGRTSA
jgi:uncharacterized membrane protein YbhN (UPF0104 family)